MTTLEDGIARTSSVKDLIISQIFFLTLHMGG